MSVVIDCWKFEMNFENLDEMTNDRNEVIWMKVLNLQVFLLCKSYSFSRLQLIAQVYRQNLFLICFVPFCQKVFFDMTFSRHGYIYVTRNRVGKTHHSVTWLEKRPTNTHGSTDAKDDWI